MSSLGSIPGGPDDLQQNKGAENPIQDFEILLRTFVLTSLEYSTTLEPDSLDTITFTFEVGE